jgi:hypothetical protein
MKLVAPSVTRSSSPRADGRASSISKECLEPLRRQRGIARRILDVAMPEIGLDRTRVVAVVGELVTAGVAQHVGMRLDAEIGGDSRSLDHAGKAGRR